MHDDDSVTQGIFIIFSESTILTKKQRGDDSFTLGMYFSRIYNFYKILRDDDSITQGMFFLLQNLSFFQEKTLRDDDFVTQCMFLFSRICHFYEKKQPSKALRAYRKFFKIAAKDPELLHHISPIKKRISYLKKSLSK